MHICTLDQKIFSLCTNLIGLKYNTNVLFYFASVYACSFSMMALKQWPALPCSPTVNFMNVFSLVQQ